VCVWGGGASGVEGRRGTGRGGLKGVAGDWCCFYWGFAECKDSGVSPMLLSLLVLVGISIEQQEQQHGHVCAVGWTQPGSKPPGVVSCAAFYHPSWPARLQPSTVFSENGRVKSSSCQGEEGGEGRGCATS